MFKVLFISAIALMTSKASFANSDKPSNPLPSIIKTQCVDGKTIRLHFDNGETKDVAKACKVVGG